VDEPAGTPRVGVFALGGTIAMTPTTSGGAVPNLTANQLVAAVPDLAESPVAIEVDDFRRLPGGSLGFDDLDALMDTLGKRLGHDLDAAVVTQGTDTIEETAYYLDLHHPGPQPIVVTGAMRNPSMAGADGPANLLAAIHAAANPATRGLGCLVVFADEIHAARRVRKTHSTSTGTFVSPNGGPLGYLVEGQPRILNRLPGRTIVPSGTGHPRIALLTATLADDGLLLSGLAERVDGLVVAGFGAGHVPQSWAEPLGELAATMPVVLTSRTGAGPVLTNTYGFVGSERDLHRRGLIGAGFLDPYKARILLHGLLAAGADRQTITAAFAVAGGYADPRTWPWSTVDGMASEVGTRA
jgi:L-asparaginase